MPHSVDKKASNNNLHEFASTSTTVIWLDEFEAVLITSIPKDELVQPQLITVGLKAKKT